MSFEDLEYSSPFGKDSPFVTMGNEIAMGSPLGKDSAFYRNVCGEFEDRVYGKGSSEFVDFEKLATDLSKANKDSTFVFDWENYKSRTVKIKYYTPEDGPQQKLRVPIDNKISYLPSHNGGIVKAGFEIRRLNKRICSLDPQWGFVAKIDLKSLSSDFGVKIYYSGTQKYRQNILDTLDDTDFKINNKYAAIQLKTENLYDLIGFFQAANSPLNIRKSIREEFDRAFSLASAKGPILKKWLYQLAPHFYLLTRDSDKLWKDLGMLLQYDLDEWFKDSSSAIIKIMTAISDKEDGLEYLYNKFANDPKLIKKIYSALDGAGQSKAHGGQVVPNQTAFAAMLTVMAAAIGLNQSGEEESTSIKAVLKVAPGFKIGSDSAKEGKDKYILSQKVRRTIVAQYQGNPTSVWEDEMEYSLHPLDLVRLIIIDEDGEETNKIVPAIFAKDIGHQRDLEEIEEAIQIGVDILIIVASIATIAGGGGALLTTLAYIDLGLASANLAIKGFAKEIAKLPGGKEFLAAWDQIYMVGGFITGAPMIGSALLNGAKVLHNGTWLLKTAEVVTETQVRLKSMLKFLILQSENLRIFVGKQFEIVTNIASELGTMAATKFSKFWDEGAILLKNYPNRIDGIQYYLLFEEKILTFGNAEKIVRDIQELLKLARAKIIDKIYEFLQILRKQKTMVNTSAKIGEEATEETIRWGTVKMGEHPLYESKMDFLKERNIKIVEIEDVINDVGYTETRVFDRSGELLLRVEKKLEVHPNMRYLDLEHEIDHIIQFESNLDGKYCTAMRKELSPTRITYFENKRLGFTTPVQKIFLELDVRIKEINRLKKRGVSKAILDEHLLGISDVRNTYADRFGKVSYGDRKRFLEWKSKHFPDFKKFNSSTF